MVPAYYVYFIYSNALRKLYSSELASYCLQFRLPEIKADEREDDNCHQWGGGGGGGGGGKG